MSYSMTASGLIERMHDSQVDSLKETIKKQSKLLDLYRELEEAYSTWLSTFDSYGNKLLENKTNISRIKIEIKKLEEILYG